MKKKIKLLKLEDLFSVIDKLRDKFSVSNVFIEEVDENEFVVKFKIR